MFSVSVYVTIIRKFLQHLLLITEQRLKFVLVVGNSALLVPHLLHNVHTWEGGGREQ